MKYTVKRMGALLFAAVLAGGLLTSCGSSGETAPLKTVAVDMGEFITNLRDSKKLLNCDIKIDITDEKMAATFAEKEYVSRDAVVRILRGLKEDDLMKADIEDTLAEQIKTTLNEVHQTDCVYRVYFVRFVYQ